ncbi:MAG: sulfite exporter TauE/SafE family protein [Phycisphaerales bacterium]
MRVERSGYDDAFVRYLASPRSIELRAITDTNLNPGHDKADESDARRPHATVGQDLDRGRLKSKPRSESDQPVPADAEGAEPPPADSAKAAAPAPESESVAPIHAVGEHHDLPTVEHAKVSIREYLRFSTLRRLRPFFVWLAIFYAIWLGIVFAGDHVAAVVEHWAIALAMALGSYVAGSTPMGGGTIGFPVLVLLFDMPATMGRDFGLAIQSIGMTSASIFIFATRGRRLAWKTIVWASIGTTIATPISVLVISKVIDDLYIKLLFAIIWASFGIMHFIRIKEITSLHGAVRVGPNLQRATGLVVGLVGGVVSGITGVGIDMIVYTVLVVLFRADLKIAIPTSVILMAYTSLVGVATNHFFGEVNPEVFGNWLAAAPVVALGAPLGALVVQFVPRTPTLLFVSSLCVFQYVWTLFDVRATGWTLAIAIIGLLGFNVVFHLLYKLGDRLTGSNLLPHGRAPAK